MNDVLGMSGVQPVGDFDGDIKQPLDLHRLAIDDVLQGAAVEKLHGDEALAFMLADFIDGANVRMIQSGSRASFAAEPLERKRIAGQIIRKKFERNEAAELGVLGLVNDSHATAAELFKDLVVRNDLPS